MREYIEERAEEIGRYIVESGATVRISKSTVHKDITERLVKVNPFLAARTRIVLDFNKAERHIRGGMATREKYRSSNKHVEDI